MDRSKVPEYVMNTLCRICAEKSSKLSPIFKNESLPLKIYKCLPIEVNKSDHLPLNVCETCFFKIDESYMLYETAFEADKRLKKLWKILLKETMICYPEEINLTERNEKPVEEAPTSTDLLENQVLLEFQEENKHEMSPSSLVISIPEEVMYGTVQVLGNDREQLDGVMVINKAITLEVIESNTDPVLLKSVNEETELQIDNVPICETPANKPEKTNDINQSKQSVKVYQCQFCSRQLSTLASLSVHEATHSQEKPFLCDTCGKSFKHANNLRSHARTHLGIKKKYLCKICNKGFLTNFFMQEHMNSHTGETPYKCAECGKEFREKVHLRQHKWTHSKEKFVCPVCGNRFNRKGNMNEHIKKYHKNNSGDKPKTSGKKKTEQGLKEATATFNCPACPYSFPNQILLKHHLKIHPEQKRFFCSICGKKFRHSGSLTYHRRTSHTGERPFQCSYCSERFSLRSVQQIHERKIHTFEHPYKCNFCSRLFTNSSSLRNHLFVHSENKMFECDECGKKFSRSSNLFVHKKLHSGDRQFTCDQCDKSYIQKHDMLKHRKLHDPKSKPFFCKYCGNSFSHKKDSTKHSMCQYEFLRKNNSEMYAAERMLDSVTSNLEKSERDFFAEDELILESVEEFPEDRVSGYQEAESLNTAGE